MVKFLQAYGSCAMLALAVVCVGCTKQPVDPPVRTTPVALPSSAEGGAEVVGRGLMGVGSCTASGCHGGGKPNQIVGSEYNIWIADDPHAQSYSVLYDERSQRMVQLLGGVDGNPAQPAYEDARCLSCHSTVFAPVASARGEVRSDGVGCEACHGPAEAWLSAHFREGFTDHDKRQLGFWDTDSLYTRAQICAGCHVGEPGREVNHDLIAAGHPRLQFEMGAYLQALPKHWDQRRDQQRWNGSFALMTWALGQAAASQKALEQLQGRAAEGDTWPELAEWSCSACHHDLRDDTALQEKLARSGGLSGRLIRWDDWNHHLTSQYAALITAVLGGDNRTAERIEKDLEALSRLVGALHADRAEVADTAGALGERVNQWARRLEAVTAKPQAMDELSLKIIELAQQRGVTDWSQATLLYDALVSLHQSRLDSSPETSALDEQITVVLQAIYQDLSERYRQPAKYFFRPEPFDGQLRMLAELYKQRGAQ